MNKKKLLLILSLFVFGQALNAQYVSQNHIKHIKLGPKGSKLWKKSYEEVRGAAPVSDKSRFKADGTPNSATGKTIFLLTPSVPFSFGLIQKDNSGNWQVNAAATLGASYSLVIGQGFRDATDPETKPIQVEPYLMVGVYLNVGVSQNSQTNSTGSNSQTTSSGGAIGTCQLGGILGIYKYVNLLAGYDVLNSKVIFGIGAHIDIFSFGQGAGSIVLNKAF